MEHIQESIVQWKVGHPNVSNNIIQMRSNAMQPPFYAGAGAQISYALGIKGNTDTQPEGTNRSATERVVGHRW